MNDAEFESMKGTVDNNGAVFEQQYFKREVTPQVFDGKVSIPRQNDIRATYGDDFLKEYEHQVANPKAAHGSLDSRSNLVNLSDIIRKKQAEREGKANASDEGGHVSELGPQEAPNNGNNSFKVEDEGGHVSTFSSKEEAKMYYLNILRKRLDKIAKKYNIEFDREFVEFFETDDFFLDGKVPSLEEYSDLEKIDKAWQTADVISDVPAEVDKTIEENYKAMQTVRRTALLFGDKALYDSVMEDSNKLDEFLARSKENALKDQKFFNEQKIKEKVEVAILAIVSHEVERYPQLREMIDVVRDAINKRTEYMQKEMRDNQQLRDLRVNTVQAGTLEATSEFKTNLDESVSLLNARRGERENLVFASSPSKIVKSPDEPIMVTANPATSYVEPVEKDLGKQLVLTKRFDSPIDKNVAA